MAAGIGQRTCEIEVLITIVVTIYDLKFMESDIETYQTIPKRSR